MDAFFGAFTSQANGWINFFATQVDALPVSYSFGAGMLASVNSCGFVMLPAFAAFYFTAGEADGELGPIGRLSRALQLGAIVTLAFVVVFGASGAIIAGGARALTQWVGWAGLVIGVALLGLGLVQVVTRRSVLANVTAGVRVRRSTTITGVLLFGAAYAIASLGCTLPIFMTVVAGAFVDADYLQALGGFLQYAAGMGIVLTFVTVGIALFRDQTARLVRGAVPYVNAAGNIVLIFAGSYLVWYWGVVGGLLA